MMKFYLKISLLAVVFSAHAFEEQKNLRSFAEYQINAHQLLTFSRHGAQIIPCEKCKSERLLISPSVEIHEYDQPIDFKRATELYIQKNYGTVNIGIDRSSKTAMYFRFGGHSDDYEPAQGEQQ
ncbi:MAG: hypothetical protein K6L60_00450 [Oceanobacter sp.]